MFTEQHISVLSPYQYPKILPLNLLIKISSAANVTARKPK
uniref:Uncharacterized protein n=1 Tax=Anguilla anguilla TaxID=7936 RepID=A0A0E9S8R1_ANGAN